MANPDYRLDRLIDVRVRLETAAYALRQAARVSLDAPVPSGFTKQIDDPARQVEELIDDLARLIEHTRLS